MNPWTAKLGCFGWLMLVAMCSWPFHAVGLGDTPAIVAGVIVSCVVYAIGGELSRRARIEEMQEAQQ